MGKDRKNERGSCYCGLHTNMWTHACEHDSLIMAYTHLAARKILDLQRCGDGLWLLCHT
jgi:hypothetical protein